MVFATPGALWRCWSINWCSPYPRTDVQRLAMPPVSVPTDLPTATADDPAGPGPHTATGGPAGR